MRSPTLLPLVLFVCAACGAASAAPPDEAAAATHHGIAAESAPHSEHEAGGHDHGFDDPERWSARWDTPERDEWQRPASVVEAMEIAAGSAVADVGAGTGYFVPHLSAAVGVEGRVVAVDVEPAMVEWIRDRAAREGLANVEARQVPHHDPELAAGTLDRILCVNTWHHIENRAAYAAKVAAALTDQGALWVLEYTREAEPGPPAEMRLDPEQVIADLEAAGLTAVIVDLDLPRQYVVVGTR